MRQALTAGGLHGTCSNADTLSGAAAHAKSIAGRCTITEGVAAATGIVLRCTLAAGGALPPTVAAAGSVRRITVTGPQGTARASALTMWAPEPLLASAEALAAGHCVVRKAITARSFAVVSVEGGEAFADKSVIIVLDADSPSAAVRALVQGS